MFLPASYRKKINPLLLATHLWENGRLHKMQSFFKCLCAWNKHLGCDCNCCLFISPTARLVCSHICVSSPMRRGGHFITSFQKLSVRFDEDASRTCHTLKSDMQRLIGGLLSLRALGLYILQHMVHAQYSVNTESRSVSVLWNQREKKQQRSQGTQCPACLPGSQRNLRHIRRRGILHSSYLDSLCTHTHSWVWCHPTVNMPRTSFCNTTGITPPPLPTPACLTRLCSQKLKLVNKTGWFGFSRHFWLVSITDRKDEWEWWIYDRNDRPRLKLLCVFPPQRKTPHKISKTFVYSHLNSVTCKDSDYWLNNWLSKNIISKKMLSV